MRFRYPRLAAALDYAAELHAHQPRKTRDSIPYLSHLLTVTGIVLEHGGDEDQAIAAILHDAAEDCGGRPVLDVIEARFGREVARLVAACTDTMEERKPEWRPRKEAYLARVQREEVRARLIKAADLLHNLRMSTGDLHRRGRGYLDGFNAGGDELLWYYRQMVRAVVPDLPHELQEELERALREYEALMDPYCRPAGHGDRADDVSASAPSTKAKANPKQIDDEMLKASVKQYLALQ